MTGNITDRIQGLRPELRQVLMLAALIGYRFSPYLLSAVSGRSEESLRHLLEEGEQQQLLWNEGDDFQFAHPLIRHVFSTTPNTRRRQRLHQQIAQALEELYAGDMEAHLCDIAHHLIRAGSVANMDTVSDYARRAAAHAARRCSWTDAARYYEAALRAAQAHGHLDPHTRAELHYQAGQAHQRAMDIGPCLDHYNRAIEAYQGRIDESKSITQDAMALTQSTQDWHHYAVALSNLIALHVVQGDFATAERHARDTRLMAPCSHLSGHSSHALCTIACAHMLRGAWTAAEQCLTMQLELEHIFGASGSTLELAVPLLLNLVQGYAGKGFESNAGVYAVEAAQTTDADLLPLLCAVAEIGYLMSDPQVGAQVYTALHHAMDQGMIFTQGWIFLIPRVLGLIATLNQWWDQADRHFQVALEDRGHADDLGQVHQFATQARTIFTHLGMIPFLQRADALQLRLQPSAPDAPQERHPVYINSQGERVASIFNRVSQTHTRFLA